MIFKKDDEFDEKLEKIKGILKRRMEVIDKIEKIEKEVEDLKEIENDVRDLKKKIAEMGETISLFDANFKKIKNEIEQMKKLSNEGEIKFEIQQRIYELQRKYEKIEKALKEIVSLIEVM